jgi:hypothetical protein
MHGDYDCCAICDDKMSYRGDGATTKAELCPDCLGNLRELTGGKEFPNQLALVKWILTAPVEQLRLLWVSRCYYPNIIDDAFADRLGPDWKGVESFVQAMARTLHENTPPDDGLVKDS